MSPAQQDKQTEALRHQLRDAAESWSGFLELLPSVATLVNPDALYAEVVHHANDLVVESCADGDYAAAEEALRAYLTLFPTSATNQVRRAQQSIAASGIILALNVKDSKLIALIAKKLVPECIWHPPTAFHWARLHASQGDRKKCWPMVRHALVLGKTAKDFYIAAEFAPFHEEPEFVALLASQTPARRDDVLAHILHHGELTSWALQELAGSWLAAERDEGWRDEVARLIRQHGDVRAQRLLSSGHASERTAKFFRTVCEEGSGDACVRMLKSLGDSLHIENSRVVELPAELSLFTRLRRLSLPGASLKEFPSPLVNLKNLTFLDLQGSEIAYLPPAIADLRELEELNLNRNGLRVLPPEIGRLPKLRRLKLAGNRLTSLPEEVADLVNLEEVDFSANDLPGTDLHRLFKEFAQQATPLKYRRLLLNLLLGNTERAASTGTTELLLAALDASSAIIRTNAMHCIDAITKPDRPLARRSAVVLRGRFNTPVAVWRSRLLGLGFRVQASTEGLSGEKCLVVGERPNVVGTLPAGCRVLTEVALKRLIDALDTPFLQEGGASGQRATINLAELLRSPDPVNQRLALGMITAGGLPPALLTDILAMALLSPEVKLRRQALALVKANGSVELQLKLATRSSLLNVSSEKKMANHIRNFAQIEGIDALALARRIFLGYGQGFRFLLEHGDEDTQTQVLGHFVDGDNLAIGGAELDQLPSAVTGFTNLRSVRLADNALQEFPPAMLRLKRLEQVDLSANKISRLPDGLAELSHLKRLNLKNNKLRKLPTPLLGLHQLEALDLAGNRLGHLPADLSGFARLRTLSVAGTGLKAVPPGIGAMVGLRTLDLSNNRLTDLPAELGKLRNLRQLIVDHNQLTTLPTCVLQLSQLETLQLGHNPLATIPSRIADLRQLKLLSLWGADDVPVDRLQTLLPHCRIFHRLA